MIKDFKNDALVLITALAALSSSDANIIGYLVEHQFLIISDDGIVINLLAELRTYLIISLIIVFAYYIWLLYQAFKNFSDFSPNAFLITIWIGFCAAFFFGLSEPLPWPSFALHLALIHALGWIGSKKLPQYIRTGELL